MVFVRFNGFTRVDLKLGYAFAYFSDPENASAAISGLDGLVIAGTPIICEAGRAREGTFRDGAITPKPRSEHRLIVRGIESRTSWQNLKDWARPAGEVNFVDVVFRDGDRVGIVEYTVSG
jgi:RNA recognition motif-containing protein